MVLDCFGIICLIARWSQRILGPVVRFVVPPIHARWILLLDVGLGFLLVFESLHSRLVPRPAKRRLLAGVILTGMIGVIGFRFIDNAAHLGGLLAGMLYAFIVFPKSDSPSRPVATITDRIAGATALAVLTAAAVFAAILIGRP